MKTCNLALASLVFAIPISASANEAELPQIFQIQCNWNSEVTLNERKSGSDETVVSYSSSSVPKYYENTDPVSMIETLGVGGTRHFLLPDMGATLAGLHISVREDGRAVRSQTYFVGGKLGVSSAIGTCEVLS
jgi:hypothetical protein